MAQMSAGAASAEHNLTLLEASGPRATRRRSFPRMAATALAAITAVVASLLWCDGARAAETRVFLFRGWFGVFSTGLDNLADELKTKGINADARGHLSWSSTVSEILRDRAAGRVTRIALVGHSQGANNVIDMAYELQKSNVPVDLLITLAPYLQKPVPSNVVRAVDYFQGGGWGAPLTAEPGFHGKIQNVDLKNDPSILHVNIDKSEKVKADIMREILAVAQAK
jgi:hypothetical protein